MQSFETGAIRDIGGKGRMDLLPMCALLRLSKYYETGCSTHGERNWEKGIPMHSFLDSAIRHLVKYMDGWTDEDHLCAAAWNIMSAMWTEEKKPDMQDIPTRPREGHSSCSEDRGGTPIPPDSQAQEKATEEPEETCSSWRYEFGRYVCYGTKEKSQCTCSGDKNKCDFYGG